MSRPGSPDVIVIGSGVGGLGFAALAARAAGSRVLVLERHTKLGGLTHDYARRGARFDPGLHYVGHMGPGTPARALMDLATGGAVDWAPLPDPFDVVRLPGLTVARPRGRRAWADELVARFPDERRGIRRFLAAEERIASWYGVTTWAWSASPVLRWPVQAWGAGRRRLALHPVADVLARHVRDPRLRAVLTATWLDHGLPPSRAAFAVHSLISCSYDDGGYVPVGGSAAIGAAMARVVEAAGGSCRTDHRVTRVLVEGGRAVGVEVEVGRPGSGTTEVHRAPLVVSDAGLRTTYDELLPAGTAAPRTRRFLDAHPDGTAAVVLCCVLREHPRALGPAGANQWLFDTDDHEDPGDLPAGRAVRAFLSSPDARDPDAARPTAQLVTALPYRAVARWRDQPWKRRDADYRALKATMAGALLDLADRHLPGFSDLVEHSELATPLTVESVLGHSRGAIYGVPAVPDRYRLAHGVRTPVPGLLLTGADVCSLGVEGALMGAAFAAGTLLGPLGFPRLVARARAA